MKIATLEGPWEMAPVDRFDGAYDGATWYPAPVPGHWQQHPDLEYYAGRVVYRTSFGAAPQTGRRYRVRANGVFYWSIFTLNGARVGEHEGYFSPCDYDVTDVLAEQNDLVVEVNCPDEKNSNKKRLLTGVFSHWDCLDPRTNPGGIWRPVELYDSGDTFIAKTLMHTSYLTEEHARVEARITTNSTASHKLVIRVTLTPKTFAGAPYTHEQTFRKSPGETAYHLLMDVPEPRLWWIYDHGTPDLYTATIELFEDDADTPSDTSSFAFGIRTFEFTDYIATLNGRRIFLRGNNYPPGDTRIATMTRARYETDFDLVQGAHTNFLRVHAHVDHPLFYEVADERGVLIWQDFPMQWYYDPPVFPAAKKQVREMVECLYNHPSIGMWCMHNEPFPIPDIKKLRVRDVIRTGYRTLGKNWNRDVMDPQLADEARSIDTLRYIQPSSGFRGLFRETGDEHLYFGWYPPWGKLERFSWWVKYFPKSLKFVTEFGSQSAPNYDNAVKFINPEWEKIDWDRLEERHHYQPGMMKKWVPPKKFNDLQTWIDATQEYQSRVNKYHIDRIRYHKYNPAGGVTPFLFLDSNPCIQWSVVDYWRTPKRSYAALALALSPVYIFTLLDKKVYKAGKTLRFPVLVVNDTYERLSDATARVRLAAPSGETALDETRTITLEPDCPATLVDSFTARLTDPGAYVLTLTLHSSGGEVSNPYPIQVK